MKQIRLYRINADADPSSTSMRTFAALINDGWSIAAVTAETDIVGKPATLHYTLMRDDESEPAPKLVTKQAEQFRSTDACVCCLTEQVSGLRCGMTDRIPEPHDPRRFTTEGQLELVVENLLPDAKAFRVRVDHEDFQYASDTMTVRIYGIYFFWRGTGYAFHQREYLPHRNLKVDPAYSLASEFHKFLCTWIARQKA
jgi:hypothetical protein